MSLSVIFLLNIVCYTDYGPYSLPFLNVFFLYKGLYKCVLAYTSVLVCRISAGGWVRAKG